VDSRRGYHADLGHRRATSSSIGSRPKPVTGCRSTWLRSRSLHRPPTSQIQHGDSSRRQHFVFVLLVVFGSVLAGDGYQLLTTGIALGGCHSRVVGILSKLDLDGRFTQTQLSIMMDSASESTTRLFILNAGTRTGLRRGAIPPAAVVKAFGHGRAAATLFAGNHRLHRSCVALSSVRGFSVASGRPSVPPRISGSVPDARRPDAARRTQRGFLGAARADPASRAQRR